MSHIFDNLMTKFKMGPLEPGQALALILSMVVLSGCTFSKSSSSDQAESVQRQLRPLIVQGPIPGGAQHRPVPIPPKYQCGHAIWMPLKWSQAPRQTKEYSVAILWSRIERSRREVHSNIAEVWIIGGLAASRHALTAGPIPDGAFLLKEHGGSYSCASLGNESRVEFRVYALPKTRTLNPSASVGIETVKELEKRAIARGLLSGTYQARERG